MKLRYVGLLVVAGWLTGLSQTFGADKPYSYQPKDGYVPDAKTALKIAEAVLVPIYGEKQIASERPLHAVLKKGVWTVEGQNNLPPGDFGGTAIIEISKTDGRILRVSHGM